MILLAVAAVVVTASAFALRGHLQARALRMEAALAGLEASARLEAARIGSLFATLENEVGLLARLLPALSPIGARAGGGMDPPGSTGAGHAADSLATLFAAALDARPVYRQIRYVDAAGGGRELVRVDRRGDAAHPVPEEELQGGSAAADILRQAMRAPREHPYSTLLPDRVHAGAAPAGSSTLRLAEPLRAQGASSAALVVDVDYAALLRRLRPDLGPEARLVVVNDAGAAMVFDRTGGRPAFHPRPGGGGPPSPIDWATMGQPGQAGLLSLPGRTAFRVPVEIGPDAAGHALWAIVSVPDTVLLATAGRAPARDLALSAAICLSLVALAGLFASRLSEPLAVLSASLSSRRDLEETIARQIDAPGEVGETARAFHALTNELVESTARIATIYRHAPAGIVSCDEQGTIVDMNSEAESMFGFAAGSAIGQPLDTLMPESHRGLHASRLASFEGHRSTMSSARDVAGRRQDGTEFPLSVALGSFRAGTRKTVIGILQDVSERHEAEEKLKAVLDALECSKAELERSNGELDRFAYIASHDLKAPLRVIDNASRWLSEDLEEFLTEDTRESMDLLRSRVHRMERLLDDLLAYSRVGRIEHRGKPVSGTGIMQEVISLVSPPPGFRIEIGDGLDTVRLRSMPISSVLLNLVSNAIKHHDRADGIVRVTAEDRGNAYAFAVEDDGPGIPAEYQERVFGMFQTLKPRDEIEGSGMGLAFVRKTVESVNGSLTLESQEGHGCVFRFTWPKTREKPEQEATA